MALIDDVKAVLERLAPRGWKELFAIHGLDITVSVGALAAELARPLVVDRMHAGFEELALDATRAVEPGIPGRSLLYHALASADVQPINATAGPDDFPTLQELDTVENYIYSTAQRTLSSFSNPVIGVFAYQYREKGLSPHRRHADLSFSRTGVARVGTEAVKYDPASRSFDPRPAGGDRGFTALPARYGVFIAEYRSPTAADQVLRSVTTDASEMFLFPVHKLFAGNECLWRDTTTALTIPKLKFAEYHINDKLRRIHLAASDNPGRVPPLALFDINLPPFLRETPVAKDLVQLQNVGDSVLTVPVPGVIVRTANQKVDGVNQLARFKVPKENSTNRFWTSLQLSATNAGRAAPEYANLRQEVVPKPNGGFRVIDLNQVPDAGTAAMERFDSKVKEGRYEAAHFVDGTCDGVVSYTPPTVLGSLAVFPAWSLVAAIDYFPQVEQVQITEWVEQQTGAATGLGNPAFHFNQGGPAPLSDGRFEVSTTGALIPTKRIPNQQLKNPAGTTLPFPPTEAASRTVTAIVGRKAGAGSGTHAATGRLVATWLPDGASDVFAPGWDTSRHVVAGADTYTTYGLGSPFPEDAKLCAALNSFWPAAAPDSSRTFGFFAESNSLLPTSIPLTDRELGYHAGHPRVLAGEVAAQLGWDGETGPYLTTHDGKTWVNAANPNRSDQTRAAFDNLIGFSGLDEIATPELIERMAALRFCRKSIFPLVSANNVWLVAVEKVADWATWTSTVFPRLIAGQTAPGLTGRGLIYVFAEVVATPRPIGDPPLRSEFQVSHRYEIHLAATEAYYRKDNTAIRRIARP